MAKDPFRYFRIEARELLDQLGAGVLDLEKGIAGNDLVSRLLRLAHTLKGAARVVRQAEIADLAHAVEDALAPHRDSGQAVPRASVDRALATLDAIGARLAQLPAADGEPTAKAAPATTTMAPAPMVRTDAVVVDALLEGLGEISSELAGIQKALASIERARDLAAVVAGQLAVSGLPLAAPLAGGARQSPALKARAVAQSMHALIVSAERSIAAGIGRVERELRQARDTAERLRLIPAASVFNVLERTARDAAHSLGKTVRFEAGGGDVRLDGQVLDTVQSALVQMVRNAVAHGIESAAERAAAGKPQAGLITLQVERRGYRVAFRCSDDGRGVDLEAVRRAAQNRGGTAAGIEQLGAAELLALLLRGGLTTTSVVTELAGRGIGLDVVREAMQRLHGEVHADSVPGRGTSVELRVPVSMASVQALLVESGGQTAAIPLDAVRCTLRILPQDVIRSPEGDTILHDGALIPLLPLALGSAPAPGRNAARAMSAVIVHAAGATAAVAVDRLRGTETIVLRPLPALAPAAALISGTHLDTEGNPCLVLDPEVLAGTLQRVHSDETASPAVVLPILIIDDSLTTRMLESSILESAGFAVAMAASAEEGLALARRNSYALFLVDVEMPGMDGFGFVELTRADPILREVPCILVTSRDAPADRRRGEAAGAAAYVVKGEFDQGDFLKRVSMLVRR